MFCYQCQETSNGNGCTKVGVCGKDRKLAIELDVLIFETIELAALNHRLREYKQDDIMASRMITDALFVSITNANFDVDSVKNKIKMIREKKSQLIFTMTILICFKLTMSGFTALKYAVLPKSIYSR